MTDTRWFGHPRGLSTLFFTEMWERFSYYGMRAILVLFMTNAVATGGMGLDDVTATAIYGLYTAAVYVVALPGGWIADRLLGLRRAVFWGGTVIAARPLHARHTEHHRLLHRPHAHRHRHRPAEAQHQRDRRRFVSRRRRAARCGILDLLHGHQPRRISRTAGVRLPRRSRRLAPWIRRRRRRHGARAHPVLARRAASRHGRRVEARDGKCRRSARLPLARCVRTLEGVVGLATDRCRAAVDWRDPPVARRLRRLDRVCSSSRSPASYLALRRAVRRIDDGREETRRRDRRVLSRGGVLLVGFRAGRARR